MTDGEPISEVQPKQEGMPQTRIMELLKEASSPDCDGQRLNAIQVELTHAAPGWEEHPEGPIHELDTAGAGINTLLESLYVDTIHNDRSKLPSLFPAFAVMAGAREPGMLVARVDWSLAENEPVGPKTSVPPEPDR